MARQGPIVHSAYEICRLIFLLAHVTYTAFDVTMQALCASYIGKKDKASARAVLIRTLKVLQSNLCNLELLMQIVFCLTSVLSGGLFLFSAKIVRLFTDSAAVIAEFHKVALALLAPIPLGGVAAVMDGSLLGAARFKYVALSQFLVGVFSISLFFLLHHHQILNLFWTAVIVRIGLSAQGIFSWWVALMQEYRSDKHKL